MASLTKVRFVTHRGGVKHNTNIHLVENHTVVTRSLHMVTAAMKLEDAPWKESYDQPI